jgi:glycosyltransferase involved in cell wall biosynthesis
MGGAEKTLLEITRNLPRDRFRATVATFRDTDASVFEELDQFTCPVHVYPLKRIWGWQAAKTAASLALWARREKVRLVHSFFQSSDLWGSMIVRLSTGAQVISSHRDMGFRLEPKHVRGYRFLRNQFAQVQAVSEAVRRHCIENLHISPERVITVYNGIQPAEAPVRLPDPASARQRIFTTANVRPIKGLDTLIRALARVAPEFPGVSLTVAGAKLNRGYCSQLKALLAELDLSSRVRFLGALPQRLIFGHLAESDLFCLPSRSEGFSNALLEAMAAGVPCIATAVGGNPEVIRHGHSGWLVPPDDPGRLAEQILAAFRHPAQSAVVGEEGRRVVQSRFTVDAMIRRMIAQYELVLGLEDRPL